MADRGRRVWGCAACVFAAFGAARAQQPIDPAIPTSGSLSGAQQASAESFFNEALEALRSDDHERREGARDRVLQTLRGAEVSVAYRNLATRVLGPGLESLAAGEDAHAAVNALRLAGAIATRPTSETIERGMGASDAGVRYAAVAGLGETLDAIAASAPALGAARVMELVERAGRVVAEDPEPLVADAAVRALERAGRLQREGFDAMREGAFATLAGRAAERVGEAGEAEGLEHETWLRAAESCRNALLEQRGLRGAARTNAALLSGRILQRVAEAAGSVEPGSEGARAMEQLAAAAESTILLMHPEAQSDPTLSDLARRGRWDEFAQRVEALTAPDGVIVRVFGVDPAALD